MPQAAMNSHNTLFEALSSGFNTSWVDIVAFVLTLIVMLFIIWKYVLRPYLKLKQKQKIMYQRVSAYLQLDEIQQNIIEKASGTNSRIPAYNALISQQFYEKIKPEIINSKSEQLPQIDQDDFLKVLERKIIGRR